MDIKGKTAIITGGASGLGEATVRRLVQMGAKVVIADFNVQGGEALAAELGEDAIFAKMDVTNSEEVQAGVDLAMAKFGAVHILVNCAGTGAAMRTVGREAPHDLDVFKRIIDINLIGTFDAIRLAAFQMQKNDPGDGNQDRGVVINTASAAAFDGQIGQASYSASKAAIVGMTLPIARDLSPLGVRICTIAPGIFDTPLMMAAPDELRASLAQQIPFPKRFGKPDEFSMLVQQIIENPMMNGETIRLDGAIRMGAR
ncbi:MAG: 3-hydroxyacyl-CoA dehydrogenase [Deltaproteobacteria bacterium]|jgi:3-hydroxyacyl-CoA dehydrogenase / 3-hydroxy-2-methylbutyryl-CoA dehydrogenase|nr:3-hydroxyacyl-CoA dehydrogenase [Deltaproteobacteria bacterium]MBT4643597.1 3-hydroxyacyl-CoA dehydrogenase [Deltaproteobacteria bacterium]MBT6504323.1 3-hydroxyacyl-CoA dehydrogenase [Deltaproteobacteria bacterium]MBT7154158.1 3-hydroxyacyl-CoA dehydrogenase [Deltaproteobacteria bacterium]MBT7710814.1 3-hydroxyacyl-CoA dehydrogenase [Deltaproteobacteria bacterium]